MAIGLVSGLKTMGGVPILVEERSIRGSAMMRKRRGGGGIPARLQSRVGM
jgi:hypothetical protein